ncbi:MAG: insulinase family protein [Bacteroidales bacterium]|nr:insulinase family protein [Bacteroidales bacterium]
MNIHRETAPPILPVKDIHWIPPEEIRFSDGHKMYLIRDDALDAIRLDIIFPGGVWDEHKPLVCRTTIDTLREGTASRDAATIAEIFDYYGSYIMTYSTRDYAGISLYSLTRYAHEVLELLEDMVYNPVFPDKEIQTYLKKQQQSFLIESEKVTYQSMSAFLEEVFGPSHPYGRRIVPTHYNEIIPEDLKAFHHESLLGNNRYFILAGHVTDPLIKDIQKRFGKASSFMESSGRRIDASPIVPHAVKRHVLRDKAVQAAITVGKKTITRNHEDFAAFSFVNMILGGYFGSRLMKNIREEKGYTYGIYSVIQPLRYDAHFSIRTETGTEVCRPALEEIYREIRRLKEQPPAEDEINLVKNYLMGSLLQSLDGALARADMIKRLTTTDTPLDFPKSFAKTIHTITPEKIRIITEKYFDPDTFIEVVAGSCVHGKK